MVEMEGYSEEEKRLAVGIKLARLRMLREKALHNRSIVVEDAEGNIKYIPAKDLVVDAEEEYSRLLESAPSVKRILGSGDTETTES